MRDLPSEAGECGRGELVVCARMCVLERLPSCLHGNVFHFFFSFQYQLPPNAPRFRQLPCGHKYCKACVEELRQKGVDKLCPLCRKPLPPGPDKLFDLGYGIYWKIKGAIGRSRPGVAQEQQREMDQAVVLLREAADQGHMEARHYCGDLYWFGDGVAPNVQLMFKVNQIEANS